jgi:hypothetical protein
MNRLLFCLFALALLSCARPDYVNASDQATIASDSACPLSFPKENLCATLVWEAAPNSAAENKFTLSFFDLAAGSAALGPFVNPAQTVFVFLWMPTMGHGSSPLTLESTAAGVYNASRAYFIMPGSWQVRVQLKQGTTLIDEADQNVSVP